MSNKIKIATTALILGVGAIASISTVPSGHRGILLQMGEVKPVVLDEGINFKFPFVQNVVPIEVRIQKSESSQTAASKDLQNVTTTVAVNYSLVPETVNNLYQDVGLDYRARIVDPAIAESLKAITAKYTAQELITKRPEVSQGIKESLAEKFSKYNLILNEISLTEFVFSDEFNKAIEAKQTAEQNALKAKQDLERIKIEKEQTITQAQAEAAALQLKKAEVTPELVRLKEIEVQEKALEIQSQAIKTWNGVLPNVTGGATPFIDISSYQQQ